VNNIGASPTQNLPNLVTPFTSPSKIAVGLEAADAKDVAVPPVEQSAESAVPLNRRSRSDKSNSVSDDSVEPLSEDPESKQQQDQAEELEKQAVIRQLAARDQEVRNHEAAHAAVGGALAGAPQFNYKRGPDGVLYAESGEVSISLSTASSDPRVVLNNAQQVQRAALAPADPSSQDRRIAAQAAQIAQQALTELTAQRNAAANDSGGDKQTVVETTVQDQAKTDELKAQRLEKQAQELKEDEARREAKREETRREEALREQALADQARSEANAKRIAELQAPSPAIPIKDLAQRILGLNKVSQDVKVGSVLDQRV
jgi:hypothetical protein